MLRESIDSNWQVEELEEESIEIPGSGGARKSRLVSSGETIRFAVKDAETLWEALQRGCRLYGNRHCLGWRNGNSDYSWMTYNEFIERSQHFGSGLINLGMHPGQSSIVGIFGKNSVQWLVAEFGCFSQSAIVVPLYHILGPDALAFLIKYSEIQILICEEESKVKDLLMQKPDIPSLKHIICMHEISNETKQLIKEAHLQFHSFKDIEELGRKNTVSIAPPKTTDISIICFTSGTTGDPKGALLTHENITSSCGAILLSMGKSVLTEHDVMISYLPMAHIFEHLVETSVFLSGGSMGFYRGDINLLVEDIKTLQPTFLPAAPRLLNKLYDKAQTIFRPKPQVDIIMNGDASNSKNDSKTVRNGEDFSIYKPFLNVLGGKIRLIISGSAPITDNVTNFYRLGLGIQVINAYGQTECGASNLNIVTDTTIGTVGPPIPCCIMKLMDVPEMGYFGEKGYGELCLKGYNVFKGYLKDPKKTSETLDPDGWLHTGDIGMILPNGCLKIVDRKKHIFKLSLGEYIAPDRIEGIYSRSPYVSQVFIYGDSFKDYLVAIVVPEEELVLEWGKKNLNCETWIEVCKNKATKELILKEMQGLGKAASLHSFEQVKNIYLHPEVLTLEDGFFTATMKMKREVCKTFFKDEIDAMYGIKK